MKPTLALLLAAVVGLAFTTARADDAAVRQIVAAQIALADAKAWRRTNVSTDLDTDQTVTTIAEFAQPNLFRWKALKTEYSSDSRNNYVSHDGESPAAALPGEVKTIGILYSRASLKSLVEFLKEAHAEEHGTFRDMAVTIIGFTMDQDGVVSTGKIWISDADRLPLKIEYEIQGERKLPSGEVRKVNQRGVGSYEYDPSIKIALPGK